MNHRGKLIVFEGGDGSGKSTQARILAERTSAVLTRQAGGTPFGERLRSIILEPDTAHIAERAEALLFMADRAEHVSKVIVPALEEGRTVVSDRYAYSSFVYQGYGRGLDVGELRHMSDWAMSGLWPDVVLLLDVPVSEGVRRREQRDTDADHFELSGSELQRKVMNGYRELAAAEPDLWRTVDGTGTVEEVAERIWNVVAPLFEISSR